MTLLRPTLRTSLTPALLAALLVAAPYAAAAQEARARPESERLAVEVVGGTDHRFQVLESAPGGGFAEFNPPRALPGWERPKGRPPLTRVRLRSSYEGDAVRLRVAAVFDDSYPADAPGPKYGPREEEVASLLAREGETVTVEGFRRLGAEPLVLKVVRFEPEPAPPPVPAPSRAISQIRSVEVVSFAAGGIHLERGTLTLINISPKGIVALEVGTPDRGHTQTAQAAGGRVLVQPGGTYQTEFSLGSGGRRTPQGYVPEPPPEALVVLSAVFEDGSYEGHTAGAARMVAWQRGRLAQFARVLSLVQGALDAPGPDALAGLKSQVAGLRIDAEPALLEELLSQFPGLSGDEGRKLLAAAALDGLRSGREESLHIIDQAAGPDARRQLESARAQVERRAGPRRD